MARFAQVLARRHGRPDFEIIGGRDQPIGELRRGFKEFRVLKCHPVFAEVELWESDEGLVKRVVLRPSSTIGPEGTSGDESPIESHPDISALGEKFQGQALVDGRVIFPEVLRAAGIVEPPAKPAADKTDEIPSDGSGAEVDSAATVSVEEEELAEESDKVDGPTLDLPQADPLPSSPKSRKR